MTTEPEIDPRHTEVNPDLKGFDLEAMAGLGAYPDGSGGGIWCLAWEMGKLRELRERIALLDAFVRKYQLVLARVDWSLDATALHPTKKQGELKDIGVLVPQIELRSGAYDQQRKVKVQDIAGLWPEAKWRRSKPQWTDCETTRDYTADIDGVSIRIKGAERIQPPRKVDHFPPCGPVCFPSAD